MNRKMFHRLRLASLVALASTVTVAMAGSCSISSSGLSFGQYQPLNFAGKLTSTDATADATVSIVCTAISTGGSYTISLGPSPLNNSIIPRYLSNSAGGPGMAFNVYLDSTYTTAWGDGFTGALMNGSIPVGDSSQNQTVFGRVPAGQNQLGVGNYSASLTMTITYNL
jgi:spore coat protein U-like protein